MPCCSFFDKQKNKYNGGQMAVVSARLRHLMSLPCATNLNKPRHILIWPSRLHINYFLLCGNSIVWCLSLFLWLSGWIVCCFVTFHFVFMTSVGFGGIKWTECKCLSHKTSCIRSYDIRIVFPLIFPIFTLNRDGWIMFDCRPQVVAEVPLWQRSADAYNSHKREKNPSMQAMHIMKDEHPGTTTKCSAEPVLLCSGWLWRRE